MRAIIASNNIMGISTYRGMSSSTGRSLFPKPLSSWTCEYSVARDLAGIEAPNGAEMAYILMRKTRPDEVFMTSLETEAMDRQYDEKGIF